MLMPQMCKLTLASKLAYWLWLCSMSGAMQPSSVMSRPHVHQLARQDSAKRCFTVEGCMGHANCIFILIVRRRNNDFVNATQEEFGKHNVNRYEWNLARAPKARAFRTPQCSSVGPQIKNGGIYSRMSGLGAEKIRLPLHLTNILEFQVNVYIECSVLVRRVCTQQVHNKDKINLLPCMRLNITSPFYSSDQSG